MLELLQQHPAFKISYSISGVALEQMKEYMPEVLESFKALAATGQVEFLAETYYHSLSFLYDKKEFQQQIAQHVSLVRELFGQTPTVFRNTELIYNNALAYDVEQLGFSAILAEGWDPVLGWRSPNFVYKSKATKNMKLLLKNYKLSDDVAFRFSNKGWEEWPLSIEKYTQWINSVNGNGDTINLFMDYETFGEHQWEDTGIFDFLQALPREVLKHPDNTFKTVSETANDFETRDEVDIHDYVSWADLERDLSAWNGNSIQQSALDELYKLGKAVKETEDKHLIQQWRKLTTSDHFYYMCTKWFSDGDVHKYFNPYDSPYEGYIAFMNVLHDLALRTKILLGKKGKQFDKHSLHVTSKPSSKVLS